jgi:PTS system nitrogen regulatory IIA component
MAMRLTRYILPECCIPDLGEEDREGALRRMVHAVAEKGLVRDERGVFAKLLARENIQSTAVGNGVAIPHCFTDEIPDLVIVVARAPGGVEFNSFDGKPTQVVFLLMGNCREYALHLKALARIARLIRSTTFIEKIVSSASVQDLVHALDEEEARIC